MRYEHHQSETDVVCAAEDSAGEQPARKVRVPLSRQDFYELLGAAEVQEEAARLRAKLTRAGESAAARREFDAAIGDLNAAATKSGIW